MVDYEYALILVGLIIFAYWLYLMNYLLERHLAFKKSMKQQQRQSSTNQTNAETSRSTNESSVAVIVTNESGDETSHSFTSPIYEYSEPPPSYDDLLLQLNAGELSMKEHHKKRHHHHSHNHHNHHHHRTHSKQTNDETCIEYTTDPSMTPPPPSYREARSKRYRHSFGTIKN